MKDFHARHDDIARHLDELAPRTIQGNVRVLGDYINAKQYAVRLDGTRLSVILEVECIDGELWAHLSMKPQTVTRLATWEELRWCKEYFLGDRKAIQVLPPRAEYINIDSHVLHLYAPLERDPVPDFRGVDSGGRLAI